ncbi:competence protein ComK [Piscibacillus halophilus]|uniref:Competence protein ComK n=1 Tax=Piscibacillus halophilus TaxID=571933 RepID=A0A1H9AZ17_9BACI|nr:competence protein ComK [Piscibacillus halophilus]SEP81996.1 competence protein ComK [Piscibacillus halophilus]
MKFNDTPKVTGKTLAILPYEINEDNVGSHVLEKGREYHTHLNPRQLMDQACKEFGSDLRGRINGTQYVAGLNRKAPIAIDTYSKVFFLPTSSPRSNECVWICYNHILYIEKVKPKLTRVHFNNGETLLLNISYSSLNNQIQKTAQYRNLLEKRVNKLQKEIEHDLLELQS